jgi:hypothetical protein
VHLSATIWKFEVSPFLAQSSVNLLASLTIQQIIDARLLPAVKKISKSSIMTLIIEICVLCLWVYPRYIYKYYTHTVFGFATAYNIHSDRDKIGLWRTRYRIG